VCQKALKLQCVKDIQIVLWTTTQITKILTCEILHKLQKYCAVKYYTNYKNLSCEMLHKLQKFVLWNTTQITKTLSCEILHKLQKYWSVKYYTNYKNIVLWNTTQITKICPVKYNTNYKIMDDTIVMQVLKALDASMGVQTAIICCLWGIVPPIHKFIRSINCLLYHIASWLGYHRVFQVAIQATLGTDSCVLDGLRNGHWTEIFVL
jgi:hypothetical protein